MNRSKEILEEISQRASMVGESGLVLMILELHRPRYERDVPQCHGCDMAGYNPEYADWPCRTWEMIDNVLRAGAS